jgi:hypothetical protein
MLRIAFFGNENHFTNALCRWLGERSDLRLIVSTSQIPWPHRSGLRWARVARRIAGGIRRKGLFRALDETVFYLLYLAFLRRGEIARVRQLADSLEIDATRTPADVSVIRPTRVDDPELLDLLKRLRLDAIFATCTPVYFPRELLQASRLGVFLWHEGITPEYRGVYAPFWALLREDYTRIGYTLLRMNEELDAGPIYLQGRVQNACFSSDWPSYLGHKAILDSLPRVEHFLHDLEMNCHKPIERSDAQRAYYSYPTATGLITIASRRLVRSLRRNEVRVGSNGERSEVQVGPDGQPLGHAERSRPRRRSPGPHST